MAHPFSPSSVISSWAVVARPLNPSTQEAETGGSLSYRGEPDLPELVTEQVSIIQRNPVSKNKTKYVIIGFIMIKYSIKHAGKDD